ncbi:hypothetical protein CBR_g12062 [Chara braunii]|uniref:Retrotransposon gag domain-containing protein n=1 Tax=Chara braunii TaxID=69332 RepID=A0A388KR22_CHABU|nr:hypothetical protein CBR_g12062 [Chara braunii]|eukprot:GBG72487.1 hypothetical protein CBR_g12062 [Chara braunii]
MTGSGFHLVLWWLVLVCSFSQASAIIGSRRFIITSKAGIGVHEFAVFGYESGGLLSASFFLGERKPLIEGMAPERQAVYLAVCRKDHTIEEAAEAERQRLANEAAAQAQQTAEADAAARDQRNAASTESLIHSESQWTTFLQGMIFVPSDAQADPTPAEAERTYLANLMLGMMRGIMWNNTLLQAHLRTERQQRQKYQQDIAVLTTAIRAEATQQQQQHQLLNSALAHINSIEANASAARGCTTDATKQLNERIDHVVTIIGDIGVFNGPDTISSMVAAIKTDITKLQTRPDATTKTYKMPHFDMSKFDDYNKSDALTWWQRFLTEASCRTVPADDMMKALYLQLIGGAQAWMNHLAATNKCTIVELHTHITWKEFEKLWFTRFMVRNVVKAAMNEVYTCSQGNIPTRDWTTKWQKIVTTPGFDLSFPNQRSEFFSRSCAGLRSALGNEYDYDPFQAILDRANLVIQTDDKAANERQSQPHYVAKQGYQRRTHNNSVISEEIDDLHAAAASSSDGGIVAALPPKRPKRVRKNKATQETTSTGTGQQPWTTYKITKDLSGLESNGLNCRRLREPPGCMLKMISSNPMSVQSIISETAVMSLAILTCNYKLVQVNKVAFVLTNPGGEHLGTRYEPLRYVYTAMLMAWLTAFVTLFSNYIMYMQSLQLVDGSLS